MKKDDERARQEFTSEAEELLDALSRDLVELETDGQNVRPEVVNKIFREVHSLKGLAGMLGFAEIAELSHNLEDMLDRLRMGRITVTRDLVDLLYDSVDGLNRLVIAINDREIEGLVDVARLTTRIHAAVSTRKQEKEESPVDQLDLDEQTRKSLTEYEEHRLAENVRSGKEILSIEVTYEFTDFDERLRGTSAVLSKSGEVISTLPALGSGGSGISFRLLYGTVLDADQVLGLLGGDARVRSLRNAREREAVLDAGSAEEDVSLRSLSRTVRVDITKLDHVMNIVGELIIEKTELESIARSTQLENARVTHALTRLSRNLDRRLGELQKSVIDIRMVPVGQIYSKLSRTVRKVARELGKEIDLVMRGEETELDKMMVDELTDPLMHIIRNAIDHGIETADVRVAAGKPANGRVTLQAYQKGNSVVIDITDDGRGIDPERIRALAVKRGLITPKETVDQERAIEILFTPGFSTADAVSEISGRGVGLDVVRKNIQDLKGSIDVITRVGQGTTFRILLPITLAIIQALIVRVGTENFAIPLTSVEESLRIFGRDIRTVERKEVFTLRNATIPLLRMADAFGVETDGDRMGADTKWFVVVTRSGERLVGLLVDALVRQQEIVIKSVGERLKWTPGIAGATEIGENEVVLVIDVGSLIDRFGSAARAARRRTEAVANA